MKHIEFLKILCIVSCYIVRYKIPNRIQSKHPTIVLLHDIHENADVMENTQTAYVKF